MSYKYAIFELIINNNFYMGNLFCTTSPSTKNRNILSADKISQCRMYRPAITQKLCNIKIDAYKMFGISLKFHTYKNGNVKRTNLRRYIKNNRKKQLRCFTNSVS